MDFNNNHFGNFVSPCLIPFNCGHYCYEPVNHTRGEIHGPCLTLIKAELACLHIELVPCYQNIRNLRCNICQTIQPIQHFYEDENFAVNAHFLTLRYHMHQERIRQRDVVDEIDQDEDLIEMGAPASAGDEEEHNENDAGFEEEEMIMETEDNKNQPGFRIKLGKRCFDDRGTNSNEFDSENDEINQPPTKKLEMDNNFNENEEHNKK